MPHLRPPSIDHGVISFVWAVVLGLFIYFGLAAVDIIGKGPAAVFAALAAFFICLFVRLRGEDDPAA